MLIRIILAFLLSLITFQIVYPQERRDGISPSKADSTEKEKTFDEPKIVGQKKLTNFTLWDYLDGKEEWKGKQGHVSYLNEAHGGLVLSKIRFLEDTLYSISYEEHAGNNIETTSLLISKKSSNKLFYPEKFNSVCVLDNRTEEHFYYSRKSIYSRLSRNIENQIDELSGFDECDNFLPVYISNKGAVRLIIVGLKSEKDEDYYTRRFESGSYIEVDSLFYYKTFNKVFTDTLFTEDFKVTDTESRQNGYRLSEEEPNYYFSGTGIKNTNKFSVESPWKITWTNDGQYMSGYLIDNNGETIEVIINSDENRGTNNIYKTGTFHIKVNSIGNWVIRIHD